MSERGTQGLECHYHQPWSDEEDVLIEVGHIMIARKHHEHQ